MDSDHEQGQEHRHPDPERNGDEDHIARRGGSCNEEFRGTAQDIEHGLDDGEGRQCEDRCRQVEFGGSSFDNGLLTRRGEVFGVYPSSSVMAGYEPCRVEPGYRPIETAGNRTAVRNVEPTAAWRVLRSDGSSRATDQEAVSLCCPGQYGRGDYPTGGVADARLDRPDQIDQRRSGDRYRHSGGDPAVHSHWPDSPVGGERR